MRIVIDLQGAQGSARHRGIGRYSLSIAQAIARNRGRHEVLLALSGAFPQTIEPIRADFDAWLPQDAIRVWHSSGPVHGRTPANVWRRKAAELVRESFLASLRPDCVYVTSLFEGWGWGDESVTSVGLFDRTTPVAASLYDLIPLMNRTEYLEDEVVESWYENKLDQVRRAGLLLAISESSRQEAIQYLGFPADQVINVGTAADPQFRKMPLSEAHSRMIRERHGLAPRFLLYTGGVDHRKNVEGLIRAYARVPAPIRAGHQLAIVCAVDRDKRSLFESLARELGLSAQEVILTGFVADEDLVVLYNLCTAFVFPSLHEGFGLPALEAMSCGAAVIGSNTSSLPEVIGRPDALFDPLNASDMTDKIARVLADASYRAQLIRHGLERVRHFSWDETAKIAIAAFENLKPVETSRGMAYARRPTMAYVLPPAALPPAQSPRPLEFSAQLLPELARHYEIDVILDEPQDLANHPWIRENCRVRPPDWLARHARHYDRVLYCGGSPLIHRVPGVMILGEESVPENGATAGQPESPELHYVRRAMVRSPPLGNHPVTPVPGGAGPGDTEPGDAMPAPPYPQPLWFIDGALGVIAQTRAAVRAATPWLGVSTADWSVIPSPRSAPPAIDRSAARRWRRCADRYARTIELFYEKNRRDTFGLTIAIADLDRPENYGAECASLAQKIALNRPATRERQLLVDISELVERDAKSGIQRVVRSVLAALLKVPPAGFHIEPVYASTRDSGYRYARKFTLGVLGYAPDSVRDEAVEFANGDVFLGLDFQPEVVPHQAEVLALMRRIGVRMHFVVYDLLPVLLPQAFPPGAAKGFLNWLRVVSEADGLICISAAVAQEVAEWMNTSRPKRRRPLNLGWFHLGADVAGSLPTRGVPEEAGAVLAALSARPSFLVVGTLEPRKAHAQTLAAFDALWNDNVEVNLVIVGKQGWMVEEVADALRSHPQRQRRLFWLAGITDEYLERVYAASACLIAASEGEGFGLPLIEAARHGLPIIARDIPVFREVAGRHAYYFSGREPAALAAAVKHWLAASETGSVPRSREIERLTWAESTRQLLDVIMENRWMTGWAGDGVDRHSGADEPRPSKARAAAGTS